MDANADRLIELFHKAKARAAAGELEPFLSEACRDAPELREQVLSLLQSHEQIRDFLQVPVAYLPPALPVEKPGDSLGHYKLLEQIGEGGCGVVYLAEQTEPVRRRVALKVIKLGMDTKAVVARFEVERQALALMDHPNIARVLEAGATATGRPFFVMELVRGTKITDYCEQARLPVEKRLRLFIQVCQAVQHAHQKGVIHRDLKPSNILVTLHDGVPVPKVIDFGIAKATTDQPLTDKTVFTALEQFIGTPAYMSPEQAELSGLDIDTRSDIYSLGVLLYELLTGSTPFDTQELTRAGLDEMRQIIREQDPPRPSTRLAGLVGEERTTIARRRGVDPPRLLHLLRGDLDWIVMKCLEKDRTRRYATANGLAADLTRYLNDEPVVARPPSASYRIHKTFRRHRLVFASAAAVTAALVIGLFASLWQTMKLSQAQHATRRQAYVSKMREARQAWEDNNLARLRELLEETAAEPDRGFEWYYWQRQAHLDLQTLRGHLGPVVDVSFSPDGGRVLTASLDGTARLWDATHGTELPKLAGHRGAVASASWSPDGQRIVTASADGTAAIWDAATGRQLLRLKGHNGRLTSTRFSPDGQYIATGSLDRTARVWRAATGEELLSLPHADMVWSVAFSPDGKQIVTGSADEKARIWDAATGAVLRTNEPPSARIAARNTGSHLMFYAGFSPDGKSIVTASQNLVANLWDARTGAWRFELRGNAHWLSPRQLDVPLTANFSPDGQQLIVGGLDFSARIWRLADATNLFTLKGHEAEITSAAFSPDGRLIVTGSYDHTARIWSAAGSTDSLSLGVQKAAVRGAAFSPDGRRIATASWDGTAMVWEAETGKPLLTLDHGSTPVWSVGFSPDGGRIVTGAEDGNFRIWDALADRELLRVKGHVRDIETAVFSRDGKRILTAAADWTAALWDAATGRRLLKLDHNQRFVRAAFSPDGRRVATVCNDNDRNTLENATAAVWDAQTGRRLFSLEGHRNGFSPVAFSPDGRFIVTGSVDWTATVWNASNGRQLHVLKGHHGQVIQLGVSPDSRRIFTGGFDNTTRVWDSTTGQELLTLKGKLFTGPGISPDGRRIIGGPGPLVIVWEAASPEQAAIWREEERLAAERLNTTFQSSTLSKPRKVFEGIRSPATNE